MNEKQHKIIDCSECVHYGKLECLDCEDADLFEKRGKAETKKCPICGSDLYEHCYMCCYEGEKVTKNE